MLVLVLATLSSLVPASAANLSEVTGAPRQLGDGSKFTLTGHVPKQVVDGSAKRIGPSNLTDNVTIGFVIPVRDIAQLETLIADLSDPTSPGYGQYLTPATFSSRFGATDNERGAVETFVNVNGMQVDHVYNNGSLITVTGTLAQVRDALGVDFAEYRDARGQVFRAPTTDPLLPLALHGIVAHVSGLDTLPVAYPHVQIAAPSSTSYSPSQLHTAYDEATLIATGDTGVGETIASVQFAQYSLGDIQQFTSLLAPSGATIVSVPICSGAVSGTGNGETTLDIEMQLAFAPGVGEVLVYNAPNGNAACSEAMYQQIATDNAAKSISTSWGRCEKDGGYDAAVDAALMQMAAQGQSFFASSGDDGAFGCYRDGGTNQFALSVNYPASDPFATGVGGTSLFVDSNGAYSSETVWNNGSCSTSCASSGGGLSIVFAQPSWQKGTGVVNQWSNGMRQVPDVALDADLNTGYLFIYQGALLVAGGTSAAAPAWAGIASVFNQYALNHGKSRLGFANPAIYYLAGTSARPNAFHDILVGNNIIYSATVGYDDATGWGSIDAANFVSSLGGTTCRGATHPVPRESTQNMPYHLFVPLIADSLPVTPSPTSTSTPMPTSTPQPC